jgi:hypothetical protein
MQELLHGRGAERSLLTEQAGQGSIHAALALPRRQRQDLHILPAGHALRLRPRQLVVGLAKPAGRKQVRLIGIAGKGPGLALQPVDHVPIIDAMLVLATQTRHCHLQLVRVPHLDQLQAYAGLHPLADQPGRHRVGVALHADRAPLAHLHRQTRQTLQTSRRQLT